MKKPIIPTWLAAALLLVIVFIGVPVANYHAETLYDLFPRFIHEMALVPLFLFVFFDAITLSLIRVANNLDRSRKAKIRMAIPVIWIAAIIGASITVHSIGGAYQILSRLVLPVVSVAAGVSFAIMQHGED